MNSNRIKERMQELGFTGSFLKMMDHYLIQLRTVKYNRPVRVRIQYGSRVWDLRSHYEQVKFGEIVSRLADEGLLDIVRDPKKVSNHWRYWNR